ncbi:DNA repair and recombination protein RAD52 [Dissostichus eleginoides]|uniref:DNA repair and recombination protein RAD52 n=1 Tax=Dissostichus eleginoides TaxID=100907 RepID=A0AAD9BJH2_DISEL|nr:DNA repair and recombination protein RAD52 [Dissostichus eleginoides]
MRFLVPLCVFLAVSAFHSALSASLESAEKEEVVAHNDGLGELQKIDQMEFEAAQKNEAAQMNVTEEQNEEARYLEAVTDESVEVGTVDAKTAEGGGNSDVAAHEESQSESSEEADGRQRREHHEVVPETKSILDEASQDSTKKEQDVLE